MVESYIFIEMDIEHFHPLPIRANRREGARGGSCSLSGPYKVLNPKFRGRSKVVKSNGYPPAILPAPQMTLSQGRRKNTMEAVVRPSCTLKTEISLIL